MGYTTYFRGAFGITPELTPKHERYLLKFARVRHMTWDEKVIAEEPDRRRQAVGLPVGDGGIYYTSGGEGWAGEAPGLLDHNRPAPGVPGLWCQWVPEDTEEGFQLVWDGGEKFYNYVEWLEFLIEHFLKPWGYTLNGVVSFRGESFDDAGRIHVEDNVVRVEQVDL